MRNYSILRTKENEALRHVVLRGKTIDLGGHKGSDYFALLNTDQPVEVANYDEIQVGTHKTPSMADHVFDLEKPFPLSSNTYENVLCINVLEHIFNYQNVIDESHRILKVGGTVYLSVPFFYNIHGSPSDYFRYTRMALERLLREAGFEDIAITEYGDGPCSAIFQNFGGSIPTMTLKLFFRTIVVGIDRIFSKLSSRYATIKRRVPLGYFVSAKKNK